MRPTLDDMIVRICRKGSGKYMKLHFKDAESEAL